MTPDAVRVQAFPDFVLVVEFSSGERRRLDMRPYLQYPAFAPLSADGLFMRARVAGGTVVWTDEIDLSPDTLYLKGEHVKETSG